MPPRLIRIRSQVLTLPITLLCTLALLAGCVSTPPPAPAEPGYLERAASQTQTSEGVTVRVAALRDNESRAVFELPLAERGIQPVWLRIENRGSVPLWFMPAFLDRDYYSPREVAQLVGRSDAIEEKLTRRAIRLHVRPGETSEGFVFTNLTRGIKLINVELMGPRRLLRFDFAREQPGGGFDYQSVDPGRLYPPQRQREVPIGALGAALRALPCCTTSADGAREGDPLNLAIIGSEREVMVALVRSGWDFTETVAAGSVGRMASAFVFGGLYRNAPVSPLYFDARPQDFAMQRARSSVSQRNHLRLWLTPLKLAGRPVWIGQISRDIGVRLTTRSPFLTTHAIDPDVDEARDFLLQDLLMTGGVSRWGHAGGVGVADSNQPRANLTGDPWFSDGSRLVIELAPRPRPIPDVELLQWPEEK